MATAPGWDDTTTETTSDGPEYAFTELADFVDWLLDVYPQNLDKARWCVQWWEHPNALARFKFLWDTWEHARLEPSHMSGWMRDHADYHLGILLSDRGPFVHCSIGSPTEKPRHVSRQTRLPTPMRPPAGVIEPHPHGVG